MPKEELVVAPQNQVNPPVNDVVQDKGLQSVADKKDEKKNRVSQRNSNPVINGIREKLKENLMETNRKSRSKRNNIADSHRAKSREIVSVLDSRKQLVRKQHLLDFEQQYLADETGDRKDLEANMKDYLTDVKIGLQNLSDARNDEAEAAHLKARAIEAAAKERKTADEEARVTRLKEMARLPAQRASAKKADAEGEVEKLDEEAKAKKGEVEKIAKKDEQEIVKLNEEQEQDKEALKKEQQDEQEQENPEKKEEVPVVDKGEKQGEENPEKKEEVPVVIQGEKQEEENPEKKEEVPVVVQAKKQEENPEEKEEDPKDLDDEGDVLLGDAGNLKDLEAQVAKKEPEEALVTLSKEIGQIKTAMPSSANLDKDVSDYVSMLKNLDAKNKPFFKSFAGWNNNRKSNNLDNELEKNKEQVNKIIEDWKSWRDYYKDVSVKPLDRTYDNIARSWYELTHQYAVSQLPEDATEEEILSAMENRSIPAEAAKSIEEYTGYFDELEIEDLISTIDDNPYINLSPEDIPKENHAPADSVPSESELTVLHTGITMYSKADAFGNQRKFVFDRTFMGKEVESDLKSKKRKWQRRGYGSQKVDSNIIYHAEQADLTSDMLDENGDFMYSESNSAMVHNLKHTYGVSKRAMYEPEKETAPEKESAPEKETDIAEKISTAIRSSTFFKHINSETILRYAAYKEAPEHEDEELVKFVPAPGMLEFANWAVEQVKNEPEVFNKAIGKLLGDESYVASPGFNEALKKETGISGLSELHQLIKIFMVIDSHNLFKNAENPEQQKIMEVMVNGVFDKAEPEALKAAKLSELLKYVGLSEETDWRAILNQSVAKT